MNLKIKITQETNRLILLRSRAVNKIYCTECGSETFFIAEDEIGDILSKVEAGELHKTTSENGSILICLDSLQNTQN